MGGLLALLAVTACDRIPVLDRGAEIELDEGSVTLPDGADLHDVAVRVTGDAHFRPDRIEARAGDALRFTAGDGAGHAVAFDTAAVPAAARAFLEQTGQASSPPLVSEGTAWVVSLEGAPAGTYPLRCLIHGGEAQLVVTSPTR